MVVQNLQIHLVQFLLLRWFKPPTTCLSLGGTKHGTEGVWPRLWSLTYLDSRNGEMVLKARMLLPQLSKGMVFAHNPTRQKVSTLIAQLRP